MISLATLAISSRETASACAVGDVSYTATVGISKAYGDHLIVRNFSVRVMRGDRVGIVGPNGAGKTTLLNLLTGALPLCRPSAARHQPSVSHARSAARKPRPGTEFGGGVDPRQRRYGD